MISSAQDQELTIRNSFNHKATLLVYTTVDKWESFNIPNNISAYVDMENHIENVIDRKKGDAVNTNEKHIKSGLNGIIKNQNI